MCARARACVAEFAVTAMSRPVPSARSPLLGHSVASISRSVFLSVSVFPRKNTISINRRTIYRKVFGEHVQPSAAVSHVSGFVSPVRRGHLTSALPLQS